jgi:hypothetical protein
MIRIPLLKRRTSSGTSLKFGRGESCGYRRRSRASGDNAPIRLAATGTI